LNRHTVNVLRCEDFDTKDGEDRTIPLTKDFEAYLRVYRPMSQDMISNDRRQNRDPLGLKFALFVLCVLC